MAKGCSGSEIQLWADGRLQVSSARGDARWHVLLLDVQGAS